MSETSEFSITSGGEVLGGVLVRPDGRVNGRGMPTVLLVHGLANDRDESGQFPYISRRLVGEGFCVARFDLRGDRSSQNPGLQLPATQWPHDVLAALAWARAQPEIDADRIVLIGASMGGAVGVTIAVVEHGLRGVVTLGSPADGLRWLKDMWCGVRSESAWLAFMANVEDDRVARALGKSAKLIALVGDFLPFDEPERSAAETMLRENPGMLDMMALEVADDLRLLSPESFAPRLSVPALIVHGSSDSMVSLAEAEKLAGTGPMVQSVIVQGGQHQLLLGSHQGKVAELVTSWLLDRLA